MARSLFSPSANFQPRPSLSSPKLASSLSMNLTLQAQKVRPLSILKAGIISPLMKSSRCFINCSPSVVVETEAETCIEKRNQLPVSIVLSGSMEPGFKRSISGTRFGASISVCCAGFTINSPKA